VAEERPLARDTAPAAEGLQFAAWRRLSPAGKFAAFLDLQQTAIALAEAGIRLRHPGASDREVFLRRVARTLDAATMRRVYGWTPERSA
jgi:hypothetical protein